MKQIETFRHECLYTLTKGVNDFCKGKNIINVTITSEVHYNQRYSDTTYYLATILYEKQYV